MNESRKNFWFEALKGGTLVGIVTVAFSLVLQFVGEKTTLVSIINFASTVVTILLVFGLMRKFATQHSAAEGFTYGRGVGFVVAMMLFVGVISGVYSAIMANFFIREEVLASVDMVMADMQDLLPAEEFESTYQMMRASVVNPLLLTVSSVLSNAFFGLLMGLCLSLLTRRQPDIFAPEQNNNENQ